LSAFPHCNLRQIADIDLNCGVPRLRIGAKKRRSNNAQLPAFTAGFEGFSSFAPALENDSHSPSIVTSLYNGGCLDGVPPDVPLGEFPWI